MGLRERAKAGGLTREKGVDKEVEWEEVEVCFEYVGRSGAHGASNEEARLSVDARELPDETY